MKKITRADIIEYYKKLHKEEGKKEGCIIPQTERGKAIRRVLKLVEWI